MLTKKILLILLLNMLLASCAQQSSRIGDPVAGKELFLQTTIDLRPVAQPAIPPSRTK